MPDSDKVTFLNCAFASQAFPVVYDSAYVERRIRRLAEMLEYEQADREGAISIDANEVVEMWKATASV